MKFAAFLTLVLSFGMSARAQESAPPEWFKKLDRNGDGKITREELPRIFDAVDTNKDGVASLEELRDYFTKNPPKRNGAAIAQAAAGQPIKPPESISNKSSGAPVKPARPPEEVFAYLDTNGDWKVSLTEFEALDAAIPYFKEHPEAVPGNLQAF